MNSNSNIGINLLNFLDIGVFSIIAIIHLCLFLVYKKQKANLYFFIAAVLAVISYFFYSYALFNNFQFNNINLNTWLPIITTFSSIFLFIAIYGLLEVERNKLFWFVICLAIIVIISLLFFSVIGVYLSVFLTIFSRIIVLKYSLKSFRLGNRKVRILVYNLLLFIFLFFCLIFLENTELFNQKIIKYFRIKDLVSQLATLCIPISISVYLATEYGLNSKNLELKLIEVQQLSQEKQESLQRQNKELQAALLQGQTTERQRVAIDLHDNLGGTISSIKYSLEAIDRSRMNADELAVQENLYSLLDKAYNDVRLLSHNLLPEEFEKMGLAESLAVLVRKMNKNSKIKFNLKVPESFGRIDKKVEFELYSICLELVNNIMKHSKATLANISLEQTPPSVARATNTSKLVFTVSDNGIGTFKNESDGRGMKNIQARVDSIGGKWTVKAIEGEGVVNEILV